jgi:hypothetical protein
MTLLSKQNLFDSNFPGAAALFYRHCQGFPCLPCIMGQEPSVDMMTNLQPVIFDKGRGWATM